MAALRLGSQASAVGREASSPEERFTRKPSSDPCGFVRLASSLSSAHADSTCDGHDVGGRAYCAGCRIKCASDRDTVPANGDESYGAVGI